MTPDKGFSSRQVRGEGWGGGRGRAQERNLLFRPNNDLICIYPLRRKWSLCEWDREGLRGVEEVWHCPLVSCLSVQVLKVLNSRSTVRELIVFGRPLSQHSSL